MFVRVIATLILTILIGLMSLPGQAASVSVKNLRMWQAPDHTRLVFDLSGPLRHKVFTLHNPHRIVIDIEQASLSKPFPKLDYSGPVVKNVRTGKRPNGELRIVFDLKHKSLPRAFVLKPFQEQNVKMEKIKNILIQHIPWADLLLDHVEARLFQFHSLPELNFVAIS